MDRTSAVGSEIHIHAEQYYLQGTWGIFLIGRSCENKKVLPAVEQGVLGIAPGRRLVRARHHEERNKRREFPCEVVVRVLSLLELVCDDYYLASDTFQCKVMSDPHDR